MQSSDLDALKRLPLLADLKPSTLDWVTREAQLQRFPAGTLLFERGERPDFLPVLLEGSVELVGRSP